MLHKYDAGAEAESFLADVLLTNKIFAIIHQACAEPICILSRLLPDSAPGAWPPSRMRAYTVQAARK